MKQVFGKKKAEEKAKKETLKPKTQEQKK